MQTTAMGNIRVFDLMLFHLIRRKCYPSALTGGAISQFGRMLISSSSLARKWHVYEYFNYSCGFQILKVGAFYPDVSYLSQLVD